MGNSFLVACLNLVDSVQYEHVARRHEGSDIVRQRSGQVFWQNLRGV